MCLSACLAFLTGRKGKQCELQLLLDKSLVLTPTVCNPKSPYLAFTYETTQGELAEQCTGITLLVWNLGTYICIYKSVSLYVSACVPFSL